MNTPKFCLIKTIGKIWMKLILSWMDPQSYLHSNAPELEQYILYLHTIYQLTFGILLHESTIVRRIFRSSMLKNTLFSVKVVIQSKLKWKIRQNVAGHFYIVFLIHGKLFITRDGKNLSRGLVVSIWRIFPGPVGPWKGFSCYQISLINLYGMYFHPKNLKSERNNL